MTSGHVFFGCVQLLRSQKEEAKKWRSGHGKRECVARCISLLSMNRFTGEPRLNSPFREPGDSPAIPGDSPEFDLDRKGPVSGVVR